MICAYKLVKGFIQFIEEKEVRTFEKDPMKFFLSSMSDETYLDIIREKIEFLIDEGYKYSEQLEIITQESGRNIKYSTYTNFVKLFILEKPENIFQNRDFQRFYKGCNGEDNNSVKSQNFQNNSNTEPENKISEIKSQKFSNIKTSTSKPKIKNSFEDQLTTKGSVAPLKKKDINISTERENLGFKHDAMPNVEELY